MIAAITAGILALTVLAGDWKIDQGTLRGVVEADAPNRPATVLLGPSGERPDEIELTVAAERGEKGKPINVFLLFDVTRGEGGIEGRFAGLFVGARRAAVGTIGRNGKPRTLASASCDVRPDEPYTLKVVFAGDKATLFIAGVETVSCDVPDPPASGTEGLLTFGAARFSHLIVHAKGKPPFEERFEGYTDGPLARGTGRDPAPSMPGGMEGAGDPVKPKAGSSAGGMASPGTPGAPMATPAPASTGDGGYAGGTLGKLPGLDGPLAPESLSLDPDTRRLVRRRMLDLLGRGPTEIEVLEAARLGPEASVDGWLRGGEFWRNWYEEELYYFLLIDQFRPTDPPVSDLPERIARGEIDPRSALASIVVSQYFSARNPGNDTFVTVVMEQVLGLKVQDKANAPALDSGKKMYDGYPATFLGEKGRSQSDVVKIAFSRRAFAERYLERLHRRVTGADLPAEERGPLAEQFEKDPKSLTSIIRGFVLAPRYVNAAKYPRAKTDPQWIRTLYVDLLGARPTYREFRDTRDALLALADSTPIRRVLGKVVVDSSKADRAAAVGKDPERWITERFLLLLGRPPGAKEREAFLAALKENGPRVVLRALVQSHEYQCY